MTAKPFQRIHKLFWPHGWRNLVVLAFSPISGASAFAFGWMLASGGPPWLPYLIGGIFALLDIFKTVTILDIMDLRAAKQPCRLAESIATLMILLSFTGHVTVYEWLTESTVSSVRGAGLQIENLKAHQASLEGELKALKPYNSVSSAQEQLAAKRWDPQWMTTSRCTKALNLPAHKAFCESELKLRLELDRAERASALAIKIEEARHRLEQAPPELAGRDTSKKVIPSLQVLGFDIKGIIFAVLLELASFAAWPTRRRAEKAEIISRRHEEKASRPQIEDLKKISSSAQAPPDEVCLASHAEPVERHDTEWVSTASHWQIKQFLNASALEGSKPVDAKVLRANYLTFCRMRGYGPLTHGTWCATMASLGVPLLGADQNGHAA